VPLEAGAAGSRTIAAAHHGRTAEEEEEVAGVCGGRLRVGFSRGPGLADLCFVAAGVRADL
jgi:hypothetical protein